MGGRALANGKWKAAALPVALALSAVVAAAGVARAEPVMQVLQRLTPYDTQGDRSFDALQTLGREAREAEPVARRALAGFLHASASVDLWLIAQVTHDETLEARLAQNLGVKVDDLPQALIAALEALRGSQFAGMAMEGVAAVRLLAESSRPSPRAGMGSQLVLAFLHRAMTALEGAANPVKALAPLGHDPCTAGKACEGVYARFDSQGRAAMQGFERTVEAWQSLSDQRTANPLISATGGQLDRYHDALQDITLSPGPQLAHASTCEDATCGDPAQVDVVVYIDPPQVYVGAATRVRMAEHGEIVHESWAQPAWPEARTLTLPKDYPGYLRHLDSLVELLSSLRTEGTREATIGVATSDRTPAHVWARVMLSARASNYQTLTALARSRDGMAREQPLQIVTPHGATRLATSDLDVLLLYRGYAVKRQGASRTTIDRVAGPDGEMRFDVAGLVEQAEPGRARTAHLRFVPNVPADALLAAAFALAPQEQALTVILP